MKSEEIPIEIVEIMVAPRLNKGWNYQYWGKKIIINEETKREKLIEYILKELRAEEYGLTSEDIDFPFSANIFSENNYYAFIYMDQHDGDHYGITVFHEAEVKTWIKDHLAKIKMQFNKMLSSLDINI